MHFEEGLYPLDPVQQESEYFFKKMRDIINMAVFLMKLAVNN
jgi:hypothetical protein